MSPRETISGIEVKQVYTPADLKGAKYSKKLGDPGEYPYTRGIHSTGYRGKLWTMRMFAGFGTAEETNDRFKTLLTQGQTGLSTAFDLPTLYGYDTDHPEAIADFGLGGVGVSSLADMEILYKDIPLDQVSVSMTINGPAAAVWAMFLANAENTGVARKDLSGTLQNDILKEFAAQNEQIYPIRPSMRLVVDTIEYASKETPKFNPISVSGYHIRERGATGVEELAFTLMDGFTYLDACIERGLDVDDVAPKLSFFFNSHNDFFEEIAKYRAARRIWATELKEKYGAKNERSMKLRFHTQTAGASLFANDLDNNVVRVTIQALAAVLGGTQSLHTDSKDETISLPSEQAAKTALRTQQIIAFESGVTNVVDPLGGSYYVESLTDKVEDEARKIFKEINSMGGMIKALENDFPQQRIIQSAIKFQDEVDSGKRIIVGVNKFKDPAAAFVDFKQDPDGIKRQLDRLAKVRSGRDSEAVAKSLKELTDSCKSADKNVMPVLIDAAKKYATLGEMTQTMAKVFGLAPIPN